MILIWINTSLIIMITNVTMSKVGHKYVLVK